MKKLHLAIAVLIFAITSMLTINVEAQEDVKKKIKKEMRLKIEKEIDGKMIMIDTVISLDGDLDKLQKQLKEDLDLDVLLKDMDLLKDMEFNFEFDSIDGEKMETSIQIMVDELEGLEGKLDELEKEFNITIEIDEDGKTTKKVWTHSSDGENVTFDVKSDGGYVFISEDGDIHHSDKNVKIIKSGEGDDEVIIEIITDGDENTWTQKHDGHKVIRKKHKHGDDENVFIVKEKGEKLIEIIEGEDGETKVIVMESDGDYKWETKKGENITIIKEIKKGEHDGEELEYTIEIVEDIIHGDKKHNVFVVGDEKHMMSTIMINDLDKEGVKEVKKLGIKKPKKEIKEIDVMIDMIMGEGFKLKLKTDKEKDLTVQVFDTKGNMLMEDEQDMENGMFENKYNLQEGEYYIKITQGKRGKLMLLEIK